MGRAEAHATALRAALYGGTTAERVDELVEATDALAAALQSLRAAPSAEGAERISHQLSGMQRSACQMLTAISREADHAAP